MKKANLLPCLSRPLTMLLPFLLGLLTCSVYTVYGRHHHELLHTTDREESDVAGTNAHLSLGEKQPGVAWTAHAGGEDRPTYSVIVVEINPHPSNLFRDTQRLGAHTQGVVVSVQFASPYPQRAFGVEDGESPFHRTHHTDASKRITIVHMGDFVHAGGTLNARQVSHLTAACEDPSQRIILAMTDETCRRLHLPSGTPAACWANVVRHYPYNPPSPDVETRNAYVPLGPRDTFGYVSPASVNPTSQRELLFNLEVNRKTSERRNKLADIVDGYKKANAGIPCHTEGDNPVDHSEWQGLLLRSKFTITPGGHNPETFRMFEALEAGSIPIVSKEDYVDPAYRGPHACGVGNASWNTVVASPFARAVSVDTWKDLPKLLDRLREEPPHVIDELQADCMEWYAALMCRTYESLLNFGLGREMWPQAGPIGEDFLDSS